VPENDKRLRQLQWKNDKSYRHQPAMPPQVHQ
jgi:hypothetical protein